MKDTIKKVGLVAGIYGSLYAGLESMHNNDCPREDLHSNFAESHLSSEMIADMKRQDAEHQAWMIESDRRRQET